MSHRARTWPAAVSATTPSSECETTFSSAHEAVEACVRVRETVEPNHDWARAYGDGYARYRTLYPAIRGVEEQDEA